MILAKPFLVQSFLNWETEAQMVKQGGVQGFKLETLMSPLGRLAFAAHWSRYCVLLSPPWAFPSYSPGVQAHR